MGKKSVIILVISIILILTSSYIGYGYYISERDQRDLQMVQEGQIKTLISIYQATEGCRSAPIQIINYTKSLVDVACLQGGQ